MEPVVFPTFPIFSSFLCAKEGSPGFGSDSLCHCCFTPVSVFSCFLLSCTRCSRCNRRRNRHSLYSRDVFRLFYSEPVCKSGTDNIRSPESESLHLPSCIPPHVWEKAGHQKCPASSVSILYPVLSLPPVQTVWSKPSDPCRDLV